jgi:hypothetical protein
MFVCIGPREGEKGNRYAEKGDRYAEKASPSAEAPETSTVSLSANSGTPHLLVLYMR